ncbi:MAG: polyprenyl synthetase family protein [Ignavibacteriaceae bacterium]|nr:polyprenyl synthetase family protein [Ignavibacteriaceae bacterium]
MDFDHKYDSYRNKVEKEIKKVFRKRQPASLYLPADYILSSPGKRLRPVLVLASADAAGGDTGKCLNAALSVEMLHNFTLVHDDIMDNADTRRGLPTLHIKYDISTAILAGDSLLAIAYEYLLKDAGVKGGKAVSSFTTGLIEVCEGQSLDKEFEIRQTVKVSEYITMITKKTAAMIQMCCELGAILSGAGNSYIQKMSEFGKNLGIAFQIQDDLLDLTGDSGSTGKKCGGDLIEGKKTFLFLTALKNAEGADKKDLERFIKNKGIKESEIDHFRDIFERTGAIAKSKKEIIRYSNKALETLSVIKNSEKRKFFYDLTFSLIRREK